MKKYPKNLTDPSWGKNSIFAKKKVDVEAEPRAELWGRTSAVRTLGPNLCPPNLGFGQTSVSAEPRRTQKYGVPKNIPLVYV